MFVVCVCVLCQSDLAVVAADPVRRALSSRNQLTGGGVTAGVLTLLTNQSTATHQQEEQHVDTSHTEETCDLKENSVLLFHPDTILLTPEITEAQTDR